MNEPNTQPESTTSGSGPLLLLPAPLLPDWEGTEPPSNGRVLETTFRWAEFDDPNAPSTDYDRACDVEAVIGLLDVGTGQGLVFSGNQVTCCFFLPDDAGMILVRGFGDDVYRLHARLESLTDADWHDDPIQFSFSDGPLVLFDSATRGADARADWSPHFILDLAPGKYSLATCENMASERVFRIAHRLLLQHENAENR